MRSAARRGISAALVCVAVLGASRPAAATDERVMCPICDKANDASSSYSSNASHTLLRGATNALFGWTELMRQPAEEVKAGGNVFTGIAKGVGYGVGRTAAGAGEILTFWVPKSQHGYVHFSKDCPICMKK